MSEDKQPRHSYFPPSDPRRRRDVGSPGAEFESALIDLHGARDGRGLPVRLNPALGPPTAAQLREATRTFMAGMIDPNTMFVTFDGGGDAPPQQGRLVENKQAEFAAWTNLGLLARATAAAIRYESKFALIPG